MSKPTIRLAAVVAALLFCGGAFADSVLYVRPLIADSNLNALDGPPSNAAYLYSLSGQAVSGNISTLPAGSILGGDFTLSQTSYITGLSVWAVGTGDATSETSKADITPDWNPANLSLYLGAWDGENAGSAAGIAALASTNPTIARDYYPTEAGSNYLDSRNPQLWNPVYKISFAFSSPYEIAANTPYIFGVAGTTGSMNLLTTTCTAQQDALSVSDCNGYLDQLTAVTGGYAMVATIPNEIGGNPIGDPNLELMTAVPEPTTLLLIGAGLGLFGLARRRR